MTSVMNNQERLDYVDCFRAFGILLMIMGHVGFGSVFDKWIHAFHMPMWFLVSGFFMKSNCNVAERIIKRIRSLIIPFLSFSLFYISIYYLYTGSFELYRIITPNSTPIRFNGALWFLPALFWADLVAYLFYHFITNRVVATVLLIVIGGVESLVQISLPLSIDSGLVGCGLLAFGYIIRLVFVRMREMNIIIASLFLVLFSSLSFLNGTVNMRENDYSNILLFWVNSIGITLMFLVIFYKLSSHISKEFILKIGKNSLVFVCVNQFVLILISKIIKPIQDSISLSLIRNIIVVIIIVILSHLFDLLLSKTPLKFVLGK